MAHVIIGLYSNSNQAGRAVAALKDKGYTKDISVVSKDVGKTDPNVTQVKQDVTDGTMTGAAVGAAVGGIGALLAGITSLVIPGVGLLVVGPLAVALTTAAAGAAAGGIVGALVDLGVPDSQAALYEKRVAAGEVLVAVNVDHTHEVDVEQILNLSGANDISITHRDV